MRITPIPTLLAVLLALSTIAFTDDDKVALFDGGSLDGWTGDPTLWRVENGVLIGEGPGGGPIAKSGYLFHTFEAGDFTLEAEVRLTGGNSGIQYRSEPTDDGDAIGPQADLDAANSYSGILYEAGGRAILGRRGVITHANEQGGTTVAELGDPKEAAAAHRPGEWTRIRVIAIGDYIRHEINGVPTCEVIDRSQSARRRGRFAIQLHAGGAMKIEVRSLVVTPFEPLASPAELREPDRGPTTVLPGDEATPRWIWGSETAGDGERCVLGIDVRFPKPVRHIRGMASGDNRFTLTLGGAPLAEGTDWSKPTQFEIGAPPASELELRATVENEGGPAGFALRLVVDYQDGTSGTIVTDDRWRVQGAGEWGWAQVLGPVGPATPPWGDVFAERVAPQPADWELPPGFAAELLYSAAPGEGSWAAMVVEGPRRIIVSPESGELFRIVLPEEPGGEVRTEPVAEGIGNAQGFCFANDALFVHVTDTPERGGGLWRLEDTDGDGFFETKKQYGSYGVRNEHGVHGIALGPDGWLYLAIGNHVPLPAELSRTDPYRNFAEDTLLPRIEDPNGHAVGIRAPAGQIVRVSSDGARWERVAGGFRNAYDLAFHLDNELFTYDADMEWDLGAPWYRAPRVIHVVSGAEIGWRSGNGKWPDGIPDAVEPVDETGMSSPTGVASALGSTFPGRWGRALFIGDWAYGRILAVHLDDEQGATFRGLSETFCRGTPLNITDLEFGRDGALYLTTGGRGSQSGLYRIRVVDRELASKGEPAPPLTEKGSTAREHRRSLEALHRIPDPARLDEIWGSLWHQDHAIRYAARVALERLPVDLFRDRVLAARDDAPPDSRTRRLAWLALVRTGTDADRAAVATQLAELPPPEEGRPSMIELRIAQLIVTRSESLAPGTRLSLLTRFDPLFPLSTGGVGLESRLLSELLAALRAPGLRDRLLAMLDQNGPTVGLHIASVLRTLDEPWGEMARERLEQALPTIEQQLGGHSLKGYIERITAELRTRAGMPAAPEVQAPVITIPDRVREWTETQLVALTAKPPGDDDPARGRNAYEKALCRHCHRRGDFGGGIGPDLTGTAGRYTASDLVRAIADPSHDISSQYEWTELETDDDLFLGRVLFEDEDRIEINTTAFGYERSTVRKSAVVRRQPSPVSSMPPGLMDALDEAEAGALLRWLLLP